MNILLSPPIVFLIFVPLVLLILGLGKVMAGPENANPMKSSIYGSGEEADTFLAAPGYKPFFLIAFFFAILHLGILIFGTSGLNWVSGVYLISLIFALIALILK
ncbi:MAG: hypothetical protein JEZ06_07865 [Anaerolineaceae bacterium]|nr:hypothetical protein [Anaerolineaceae bacterium]